MAVAGMEPQDDELVAQRHKLRLRYGFAASPTPTAGYSFKTSLRGNTKGNPQRLAVQLERAARRAQRGAGDRGAEIAQVVAQEDRRRRGRDRAELDDDARDAQVHVLETAVAKRAAGEIAHRPPRRPLVHEHRRAGACDADALLAELLRGLGGERERVHLDEARVVAAGLDRGGEAERVEQRRELP